MKVKNDQRSQFSNLSNWKEEAWKKSGLQRDSNPWPSSFQLLKLENLLRWSFFTFIYNRSSKMNYFIYTSHHFHSSRDMWTHPQSEIDLAPYVWLHSSLGRATHRQRRGHGFESRWSPDFFCQASSFQLLKLEILLRWSFFTFIYNRSSKMNYFIYFTSFHSSREIWTQ